MTYRYSKETHRLLKGVLDRTGLSGLPEAEIDALSDAAQIAFEEFAARAGTPMPHGFQPVEVVRGGTALQKLQANIVCGVYHEPTHPTFLSDLVDAFEVPDEAKDRFFALWRSLSEMCFLTLGLDGAVAAFTPLVPASLISDGGN